MPTTGNWSLALAREDREDFAATATRPFAGDDGVFAGSLCFFATWSFTGRSLLALSVMAPTGNTAPLSATVALRESVSTGPQDQPALTYPKV